MPTHPEKLFCRIAVDRGYITAAELDRCLEFQRQSRIRKHVGSIMKILGFVTPVQFQEIMALQKRLTFEESTGAEKRKHDRTFGFLCIKRGFMTEEQVIECVREQAHCERVGLYFKLGEICVNKGYLTGANVDDVLELQKRLVFECPECRARYNAVNYEPRAIVACTECGADIEVPGVLDTISSRKP
ncbi:MAG: hypothetical protein HY719_02790 [Planctomycetes bacterium]|nr:hypothetical protein [Planctomycetota bacterium]